MTWDYRFGPDLRIGKPPKSLAPKLVAAVHCMTIDIQSGEPCFFTPSTRTPSMRMTVRQIKSNVPYAGRVFLTDFALSADENSATFHPLLTGDGGEIDFRILQTMKLCIDLRPGQQLALRGRYSGRMLSRGLTFGCTFPLNIVLIGDRLE